MTLDAPLERIPYHLRGGRVVGTAEPRGTTRDTKAGPLTLLVALPARGAGEERSAHGVLYNDDGESVVQASRARMMWGPPMVGGCAWARPGLRVRRDAALREGRWRPLLLLS